MTGDQGRERLGGVDADAVARLFNATMRLAASWNAPPVLRSYIERSEAGVEPGQYRTLLLVAARGPVRLRDVAAGTDMTASNASKIVSELVDAGLVTRTVPPDDRRVTLLELTAEGRLTVDQLDRVGREMLSERLTAFSGQEIETLGALLGRLADATAGWTSTLGPNRSERREEGDAA